MQPSRFLLALMTANAAATGVIPSCPKASSNGSLAYRMVESNIERGQGAGLTSAATGFIQLGLFQQALRASIAATNLSSQKAVWTEYLEQGILSSTSDFLNVTADVERPHDRFSLGTSYVLDEERGHESNTTVEAAIKALEQSAALQPRNADGSLWYYDNVNNLTLYHNLSYLDGMFSYAPFAILASEYEGSNTTSLGAQAAWEQVKLLYDICRKPSGLLVHGFDASKARNWSNPTTGASPEVWSRSLAWYTLGLLNSVEILPKHSP